MGTGTSGDTDISNEDFNEIKFHRVIDFDLGDLPSPPTINIGNTGSVAMTKFVTPWPEISFEKIAYPRWDGVTQYQGDISNRPSFVSDYHFISLMRNIDIYLSPNYQGYIKGWVGGTPSATTPNNTQP